MMKGCKMTSTACSRRKGCPMTVEGNIGVVDDCGKKPPAEG